MTAAVEQATGHQTPRDTQPPPEAKPSPQPVAMQQDWGCHPSMPSLSQVVPGWKVYLENHIPIDGEHGTGAGGEVEKDNRIPPHRRKVVRTRAAPAGPHPYLDRFASGMHRPLEGEDASWRKASIQPVPIPDLGHTGIRTKFSTGMGNGFNPNGGMTETFRTGIHDTVRNLRPPTLGDVRDMKIRDYARAIRKHRVDPCAGSLLHAHMSSLELDTVGPRSSTPFGGGAGPGCLRQSSSLGTFRSRFSPPSSPLSTRRAFAGYSRGRSGKNSSSGSLGGLEEGGLRGVCSAPSEERQTLLRRELSSVQLAAATVAGITSSSDGGGGGGREGTTKASPQGGVPTSDAEAGFGHSDEVGNGTVYLARSRQDGEENSLGFVGGWHSSSGDADVGDADKPSWRANNRARGRRRGRPTGQGIGKARPEDSRNGFLALPEPTSSAHDSSPRATPAAGARKTRKPRSQRRHLHPKASATKPKQNPKPRYLKKPFSSDSLLACLLDVRFGNTRDLSPARPAWQKWDLRTIPAGITAGMSATAGGWDGFDESDDLAGMAGNDAGMGDSNCGSRVSSALGHGGVRGDADFDVVRRGNNESGGSNGDGRERGGCREGPNSSVL